MEPAIQGMNLMGHQLNGNGCQVMHGHLQIEEQVSQIIVVKYVPKCLEEVKNGMMKTVLTP